MLRRVNTYLHDDPWCPGGGGTLSAARPAAGLRLPSPGSLPPAGGPSGGGGVGPSGQPRLRVAIARSATVRQRHDDHHRASGFMGRDMTFCGSPPAPPPARRGDRALRPPHRRPVGRHRPRPRWLERLLQPPTGSQPPGPLALRAVLAPDRRQTAAVLAHRRRDPVPGGGGHHLWPGFLGPQDGLRADLRHRTVGVAHRTLPCGTRFLYYDGRTIEVPVIDRGPYANGADWDLTRPPPARCIGTAKVGAATFRTDPAG